MSRALRGLTEGLQAGMKLGSVLREAQQRDELAKAYGLTPEQQQAAMATPEQLAGARAETQALQQQDIAEFGLSPQEAQRYAPTMPQEGQRVGLPTYRLGGQTFQQAPSQEQIDAARLRAAADVYGRYGDVAKREELMRGLRAEERATAAERRAQTGFETSQQEAQLRIGEAERQKRERESTEQARKDLAAIKSERPLTMQDFNTIAGKYNLDPTKFVQADEILETKQIKDTKRALSQAALGGEEGINRFLAEKFDPDKTDNITPKLSRDKSGNLVVTYGDRVLSEYGAHKNVMSLVGGVLNVIDEKPFETLKTLSELDYRASAADANRATVGLRSEQLRVLLNQQAGSAEAARILQEYMDLTPREQDGEKGRGLIKQFNMANAKAGTTVPLGTTPKAAPELPAPVMKRYEELIKSDRWQRAPNLDAKIQMLKDEGISPAAVGLSSPIDALIDTMRRGPQPAAPARGTAAGQQLLGLADVMLPPAPAPAPTAPTTSRDRMRGLYLGQ